MRPVAAADVLWVYWFELSGAARQELSAKQIRVGRCQTGFEEPEDIRGPEPHLRTFFLQIFGDSDWVVIVF